MYQNYLLFVPSLITRSEPVRYTLEVDGVSNMGAYEYEGLQTNEAVTKFIIDLLAETNESLDKIVLLCTKEVKSDRFADIDGRTTLEYYRESVTDYLCQCKGYSPEQAAAVFEIVDYAPKSNENENQIIEALTQIIRPEEKSERRKRLFIDFTGGFRSAALTLVFAGRILDKSGVEIAKILYSNLKKTDDGTKGVIEECTRTYQIFSSFEKNIRIEHGIIQKDSKDELDSALNEMVTASRMSQKDVADRSKNKIDAIVTDLEKKELSYTERQNIKAVADKGKAYQKRKSDPLFAISQDLKNGNYADALNTFREKIADVLIDEGIIKVKDYYMNNRLRALDEMAAAYYYYCGDKKKNTFLQTMKEYIGALRADADQPPLTVKRTLFGEDFFKVNEYVDQASEYGYQHNERSRRICNQKIMPYVEDCYHQTRTLEAAIDRYLLLDRVYMGYGFPFACTYGGKSFYNGYDWLYQVNFQNGADRLQKYYEGVPDKRLTKLLNSRFGRMLSYQELLDVLTDETHEEILRAVFPFQLYSQNIKTEEIKWQKWNDFMFAFIEDYIAIKAARNKTAHKNTNWRKGEGEKALYKLERIIAQIEEMRTEIRSRKEEKDDR